MSPQAPPCPLIWDRGSLYRSSWIETLNRPGWPWTFIYTLNSPSQWLTWQLFFPSSHVFIYIFVWGLGGSLHVLCLGRGQRITCRSCYSLSTTWVSQQPPLPDEPSHMASGIAEFTFVVLLLLLFACLFWVFVFYDMFLVVHKALFYSYLLLDVFTLLCLLRWCGSEEWSGKHSFILNFLEIFCGMPLFFLI